MKTKNIFWIGLLILLIVSGVTVYSFAASITSIADGNWGSTGTWSTGTIPGATDTVTIAAGTTVTINTTAECTNLTVGSPNGILQFVATGANLTVNGNITVGGTFNVETTSGDSTITCYGSTTVSGNANFNIKPDGAAATVTFSIGTGYNFSLPSENANAVFEADNGATITATIPTILNQYSLELKTNTANDSITLNVDRFLNAGTCTITGFDADNKNISIIGSGTESYMVVASTVYIGSSSYSTAGTAKADFSYAKFSNLGSYSEADKTKWGVYIYGLNGFNKPVVIIESCEFYSCWAGLIIAGCDRLVSWYGNYIQNSSFHDNTYAGIYLYSSNRTELKNNTAYSNVGSGNTGYGIMLENSNTNYLDSNTIYSNKLFGIYLYNSDKNLLESNTIYSQTTENGIYLYYSDYNCLLSNTSYSNFVHGISMEYSSNNILSKNLCYSNSNGGIRLRYSSNTNVLLANKSYGNTRTGLSSYDSKYNLAIGEYYGHDGTTTNKNTLGDIFIEGEADEGKISQIWLKNCLLASDTELTDTTEKQEFTKADSWIISEKHDNTDGLVKIWGHFSLPQTLLPQGNVTSLNWKYSNNLYSSLASTPFIRYDDASSVSITEITISTTTKTEAWLVTHNSATNKWQVEGSVSGVQTNVVTPDTDYESDDKEVAFRITHSVPPLNGIQYVFFTAALSDDSDTQKEIRFIDFSDTEYIGASFENRTGGTIDIAGNSDNYTLITHENISGGSDFYYDFKLGGTVTSLKYTQFDYLNTSGLQFNSVPSSANVQYLKLQNIESGGTHLTSNVAHTFDNIYFDNTGTYNTSGSGTIVLRDYSRTNLSDNMTGSVTWDPTLTWVGTGSFTSDGVDPNDALTNSNFEFRIKYTDLGVSSGGNEPSFIQVWVDVNDDGSYGTNEKFNMTKVTTAGVNDNDYTNGETYTYTYEGMLYAGNGQIFYRFYATNPYSTTTVSGVDTNEATGEGTVGDTYLSISGTTPQADVTTPSGEQSGETTITYTLTDSEANTCSITCKYALSTDTSTWISATKGTGGDDIEGLTSSSSGVTHTFVWNTRTDLPNQKKNVKFKITPADISGTGTAGTSEIFTIINTASASKSTVSVDSSTVSADGTSKATITITLIDPLDNPVQGKTVTIEATGSDNTITQPTSLSDSNGQTTAFLASTKAEAKTITATVTDDDITITQQATVTFTVLGVDANTSSITAALDTATANGIDTITLVITLKDRYSNPIPDKEVSLSATGTENTLIQPASLTDSNGQTSGSIASTKIETKSITATNVTDSIQLAQTKDVYFLPESGIEVGSDSLVFGDTQKGELNIYYANPQSNQTTFKVFNLSGMLVYEETIAGSENVANWNGKDKDGQSVETGIYIYQLEIGSTIKNGTLVVIK